MNEKMDLVNRRDELLTEQIKADKVQTKNVTNKKNLNENKNSNKDSPNWYFPSYEFCFTSKAISRLNFLLPTIMIRLEVDGVLHGPFRALLDTGAQPMLISHTLFKKLNCVAHQATKRILGLGSSPFAITRKIDVVIRPWFESHACTMEKAWILPHQTTWRPILPSKQLDGCHGDDDFRMKLADPEYFVPKEVHIILGVEFVAKILDHKIGHELDGVAIVKTDFGNVVMGEQMLDYGRNDGSNDGRNVGGNEEQFCNTGALIDGAMGKKLDEMIERLWEMDRIGSDVKRTKEEEMVEQHFMSTHTRDDTGRFTVHIPIKPNVRDIGSSRQAALRRFMYTEKKLMNDPELKEFYVAQMREEIRLGHMKPVTRPPNPGEICYHIPHHCVAGNSKPRVVYDASCKTNKGISLNDVQMLGEKLQPDLHEIVMRLRKFRIIVCGDVMRMFNQVNLHENQWDLQRIFWRENPDEPLREYWITVVTFGLTASAYLSVRCVLQAAKEAGKEFPEASKVIERDVYMDDCATGGDTVIKALDLVAQVYKILLGAGFVLRKWKSNSNEVLDALNKDGGANEEAMVFAGDGQSTITTVLGLKWLFELDKYTFEVKTPLIHGDITKRKVVSCVAQLYDPNGYIGPVIVIGKSIIQKLWQAKLDWDEKIDGALAQTWLKYWEDIKQLENFGINRWIGTSTGSNTKLMGFSDSSQIAYGAVVYSRTEHPDGSIECHLLMSKSRVAPLKVMTIPRLELAGAELLSRLIVEVKRAMEFEDMDYTLWTDSTATLYWLRKDPANLKVYVSNRVASIQKNTDLKHWRYVNTKDNPADLLSRGVKASEIVGSKLWLHGPEWLSRPESEWPAEKFALQEPQGIELELRVHTVTHFNGALDISESEENDARVSILEYADKLEKAQRILAYCIRYLDALKTRYKPPKRSTRSSKPQIEPPTEDEKARAMQYFIKKSQEQHFNAELTALGKREAIPQKSKLVALNPKLDNHGVMRVGGRLDRSIVDYEMRHPAIIPKGSRLAWLVMDMAHRVNLHGGTQVAMQWIRQRFWIPQLRDGLKHYTRRCMRCVQNKPPTQEQLMADLPADRVNPGDPFEVSGVDYAGPFAVKHMDKDGGTILVTKMWVALFVCMKVKAVHLELVTDLTSSKFIDCYEKFVNRRGPCYKLYSDNGTSFTGAEKEISRAYKEWRNDGTVDKLAAKGTRWIFMTPGAPQGGIYEAAVKSMKFHLKRIVGPRTMEFYQLTTLLTSIEAVLNSRPLTQLTDDPSDLQALTPGHFLINRAFRAPPPFRYVNESNVEGKRLWNERQRMLQHFWERWSNEYLTSLQERKKWRRDRENVKIGQLVLMRDENLPPTQWKLGRIFEVSPSKDGLVRNVLVKTENGAFKRPIQKICILPVDSAEK